MIKIAEIYIVNLLGLQGERYTFRKNLNGKFPKIPVIVKLAGNSRETKFKIKNTFNIQQERIIK